MLDARPTASLVHFGFGFPGWVLLVPNIHKLQIPGVLSHERDTGMQAAE